MVLVTGCTGFKGSWLCLWLRRLGARVVGYSLAAPTSPSLFESARVADDIDYVEADVRDLDRLTDVVLDRSPEIILHLAAQALVSRGYEEPVETFGTNVMGTVHVLEAARAAAGVRAVVCVTSDKCYEPGTRPHREDDRLGGKDPYSGSKACAELVVAAYRTAYPSGSDARPGPAVATARGGNVIGGGDWAEDRLVPDAIRAFMDSRPVRLRRPDAVRPWQHVLDPLAGYLSLARRLTEGGRHWAEAWNFGPDPGGSRPVRWVVDRLAARWGAAASWESPGVAPFAESPYLSLDAGKARRRLGWAPLLPLEEALDWTVEWYADVGSGLAARAATEAQLHRYLDRALRTLEVGRAI